MVKAFQLLILICISAAVHSVATAASYKCKNYGDYVCAVNLSTGQCTSTWNKRDGNPMYQCRKYIGETSDSFNPSNYRCIRTGDGVCAQSLSTGQCTHEWKHGHGGDPMYFCKKHLGLTKSNWNPRNYVCKRMGDRVCAMNIQTGQCTHEWVDGGKNDGNAMQRCQQFLN